MLGRRLATGCMAAAEEVKMNCRRESVIDMRAFETILSLILLTCGRRSNSRNLLAAAMWGTTASQCHLAKQIEAVYNQCGAGNPACSRLLGGMAGS